MVAQKPCLWCVRQDKECNHPPEIVQASESIEYFAPDFKELIQKREELTYGA